MQMNSANAQYGIIMQVKKDDSGTQAKVHYPLWSVDSGFINTTIPLDVADEGKEVVVVFINADRNQGCIIGVVQGADTIG